jgi:hypothetical protein
MSKVPVAAFVSLSLLALAARAQDKPNFSGVWVLNKAKSTLVKQLGDLEKGVISIEHHDSVFRFSRTFTIGGKDDNISYELTTDGKEVVGEGGNQKRYSRLYWDGDALVFVTRMVAPQSEAINVVHYRLLEDGRELRADEQFRGPKLSYDNVWVLEKRPD